MKEGKENKIYSAEDIRKYLEGELSGPEMQTLEKAALDDPFLADAIEGLEERLKHPASIASDLAELRERLAERIRSKEKRKGIVLLFSKWQIAAAVLFVIGTAVLTYTLINNSFRREGIANTVKKDRDSGTQNQLREKTAADSTNAIINQPALVIADSSVVAYQPAKSEKKSTLRKENALREEKPESKTAAVSIAKEEEFITDKPDEKAKMSSIAKNADQVPNPAPLQPATDKLAGRAAGIQVNSNSDFSGKYIQGIVLDDSEKAIPFATVSLSKSKNEVSTDSNGYFKLYLKKGKSENELDIRSIGYQPYSAKFNQDSSLMQKFQLRTSSESLNEVVVTGYGTQKKKDVTGSAVTISTKQFDEPEGWDSLIHYINTNKKIITADSTLKGNEVIGFVVNKTGEISSIKVIHSLSKAHDAEIIRLLQSGPPLKIQKDRKQKCQVSISFN